ncbi:hypothetical protein FOZ62_013899, partial [Perkinsus olseni]
AGVDDPAVAASQAGVGVPVIVERVLMIPRAGVDDPAVVASQAGVDDPAIVASQASKVSAVYHGPEAKVFMAPLEIFPLVLHELSKRCSSKVSDVLELVTDQWSVLDYER